jgi:hypothetical protein
VLFGENLNEDRSRKPVQINPPNVPDSKTLWYIMNYQCSVAAGWSSGPDEKALITQNDDKVPSEVERMKKATEEVKKP